MKSHSVQKNTFLGQYESFIKAIQEHKPQKIVYTLAKTILDTPPPPSIKAKKEFHKIEVQLNKLSPQNKRIQALVNNVLQTIPSLDTADNDPSKKLFSTLKNHCDSFIKLIRNRDLEEDDKILAATALLNELTTIDSLDNTQIIDLLGIKARLIALHKSTTSSTPIKNAINAIIEKTNELVASSKKPQQPSNIDPNAQKGIINQGNDCFLIALCQVLRSKSLVEHLVNRLPKELWEPLVVDNTNDEGYAKYLRKAIVKHTSFGSDMKRIGANPMTSQLDAEEALMAILGRIDEADNKPLAPPRAPAPVPQNPLRKDYNADYAKATNFLVKTQLFTVFWMTMLCEKIQNAIVSLLLTIFSGDDDDDADSEPKFTPQISVPRPQNRPTLGSPNPLHLHMKNDIHYTPDPGVPAKYRNHQDFGGPTHKGSKTELNSFLPLSMEKTPEDIYHFEHILKKTFSTNIEDDPIKVTITSKKGKKTVYTAALERELCLAKIPDFLLLSLKRSRPGGQKIKDPVEGLDLEVSLPPELLETQVPAANRTYTLESFVSHLGSSSNRGHYVAYRKEADGWHYFNDDSHTIVDEETVKKAAKQAYLVFYERKKV